MGQARRWASVALSGLVAAFLCLVASGPALAASAGTEVLDWNVSGSIEAGGIYSSGERGSSKFNEYRDMDNGFVGELTLRGEKKDSPYHFDLRAKNPARDDQGYEGEFGRFGLFRLDLGWDRTLHVLSNSAQTIFQENSGGVFTLPSQQRSAIAADTNAAACGAGVTRWNCPVEYASSTPAMGTTQRDFIRDTINGLLRPVDLRFNTDVARAGLKVTPTEELRFDVEYSNLRREGHRPVGTIIGSPGGAITELAVPIENYTHEVKVGAEYARPEWALQFGYTGSIFKNEFTSYTWDNPGYFGTTDSADFVTGGGQTRAVRVNQGQIGAPPDNMAHTLNLTGSAALPLRSRVSGTFAYSLLRQDETFLNNTTNRAITQTNFDTAGNTSPDAKANLVLGNIQLTSRPFNSVTAMARYRYFEYQNDTPFHQFSFGAGEGLAAGATQTAQERYTKQNAGLDLGWRPIQMLSLKAGYEYEHWLRGDRNSHSTTENIGKFAADITPIDWFLGRVTYSHGDRYVKDYDLAGAGTPAMIKFDQADRRRDRVDLLLQLSPWETVTPSASFGYAQDDYYNSTYGLKKDDYYTAGAGLGWSPLSWLQFSADYTFERYNYKLQNAGSGATAVINNNWDSRSKDDFHTVALNAVVDLIPKKFDVTLGYAVTFGYTKIRSSNLSSTFTAATATSPNSQTFDWDTVRNILQTVRVVGRYHLTEKLSLRGGFAYERYTEKDFARDPMQPFMGDFERATPTSTSLINPGVQSVYLGATQPSYEAYILSFLVRYGF